jgi:hypothetical protein
MLVLHGQYDWIMSHEDHELIARYVNANQPGAARFIEVAETHISTLLEFRGRISWKER